MPDKVANDQEKLVRVEITVPEAALVAHLLWCHGIDTPDERALTTAARDKITDALYEAGSGWVP